METSWSSSQGQPRGTFPPLSSTRGHVAISNEGFLFLNQSTLVRSTLSWLMVSSRQRSLSNKGSLKTNRSKDSRNKDSHNKGSRSKVSRSKVSRNKASHSKINRSKDSRNKAKDSRNRTRDSPPNKDLISKDSPHNKTSLKS